MMKCLDFVGLNGVTTGLKPCMYQPVLYTTYEGYLVHAVSTIVSQISLFEIQM